MSRAAAWTRRVTRNWQLKLSSLALAVLLWALVRAEQPTEQWVTVRVEPHILDPDLTLAGRPDPATVRIRLAGRWRELGELAIEKPVLVLHVRNAGRRRVFVVEPPMVRLPERVRGDVTVLDVRPSRVRLPLVRTPERSFPRALPVVPAQVDSPAPAESLLVATPDSAARDSTQDTVPAPR